MRDKVVDKIMLQIKDNNKDLDNVKYAEIRYGLQAIYTLVTKTFVIFFLAIILNIFYEFILFFVFYSILRSVGYGTHANSNLSCWIFSTLFLIGIPLVFSNIVIPLYVKIFLWILFFINFIIFAPADTKKKPMINKKRKLKFKIILLLFSLLYLVLLLKFNGLSNYILSAMLLESILVNPIGYLIMGEEIRFSLNDINFKQN